MASLYYRPDRETWVVKQFLGRDPSRRPRQRATTFKTEEAALAWMAANGLERGRPGNRPGVGGRSVRTPDELRAVIARNIRVDENGCHVWTGTLINSGYGRMTWKRVGQRKEQGAHRISYIVAKGEIPDGLWIDHLCRNRACVNPDHLETVTPRENVMRSPVTIAAQNAAKTHCPQGHEYTPDNTVQQIHKNGTTLGRLCRACQKSRARKGTAA